MFTVRASLLFSQNPPLLIWYSMKGNEKIFRFHPNLFLSQVPKIISFESEKYISVSYHYSPSAFFKRHKYKRNCEPSILHNFYELMLDYFPPWESLDYREHRMEGTQRMGKKVQETNFTIFPGARLTWKKCGPLKAPENIKPSFRKVTNPKQNKSMFLFS